MCATAPTWSQSPLVDPVVDFGALLLELVDPGLHVGELALKLLDLLRVGPHRLVEGLGKQIRHGRGWHAVGRRHSGVPGGQGTVGGAGCALLRRVGGVLGLLGARIHVVGGRRGELVQMVFFARGAGAVLVKGLVAAAGLVLDV